MKQTNNKKRVYLKKGIETLLLNIEIIIMTLITITIENIGNKDYNFILIVSIIVFVFNAFILINYSRVFED